MKIAIVHDYIKEYGGAERVLETLHEMYPDAPVFTLVYCPEFLGPHKMRFANWDIRPSILQKIPFRHKLISPFRLLAPFIFPLFNFSGYDVVIVSATGAYCPNTIRTKQSAKSKAQRVNNSAMPYALSPKPFHVCYYHTPPRYLYGFATAREWKRNPFIRIVATVANAWLKKVDIASSQNVDVAIANSHTVEKRIEKFYKKKAVVIYPPVEVPKVSRISYLVSSKGKDAQNTKYQMPNTSYYLAGGRLARPKHIDLLIQTANQLKLPLKIFGKGFAGYGEELKSIAGPSVELLGEVSDEEKKELLRNAKAFLFAAEDEDFGMLPVEAMGAGTPVVAYKSGGPTESILDGKTGVFFNSLSIDSIINAIGKLESISARGGNKLAENCREQAEKFSKEEFVKKIKAVIENT